MRKTKKKSLCKFRKWAGFTLVELIVVIAILAVLAAIGFLALSGYSSDAKDSVVKMNVRSVQTAISTEGSLTGNSPRYYVIHDPSAALTGAFVYVDGNPTVLTGWAWDAPGTNYSAGNPDYVKLRMNPEKFKVVSNGWQNVIASALAGFGDSASAAYDAKYLTVGAADILQTQNGKTRTVSYFQVAGIAPATGTVAVSGTYPTTLSGSVSGLVKDQKSSSSTGTLVDGATVSSVPAVPPAAADGTCGTAAKTYASSSVSFGSDTFCVSGSASPSTPSFPAASGSVNWTCPGQNNGNAVNCSASRVQYPSCAAIKSALPASADGTYSVDPDGTGSNAPVQAYCDMTTDGGGWTMVAKSVYKSATTASGGDLFVNSPNNAKGDTSNLSSPDTVKMTTDNINAVVFGGQRKLRLNRYDLGKRWVVEYATGQTLDFTTAKSYNVSLTLPTQDGGYVTPFYYTHPHFMLFAGITDNGICTPATGNSRIIYGVWNSTLGTWGSNCNGTAEVWTPYVNWIGCGGSPANCVSNGLDFTLFAK